MPQSPDLPIRSYRPEELFGSLTDLQRKNAPDVLFIAGDEGLLQSVVRVSVVGARRATEEGLRRTARLTSFLVSKQVAVVSGLAQGIDFAAHTEAIKAGGRTIAVLGTPLDRVYPPEHDALQKTIMREHLAVSQFPPGSPVSKTNFPRRNRTMALLSHATVIVEAGDSSGTLHQGWEALRLNRPLFIMKSATERKDIKWPAEMLHYGAVVLADAEAMLDFLPADGGGLAAAAPF